LIAEDRIDHDEAAAPEPQLLQKHEIAISMDGKGAWRDNVFIERL
jgi:hypothetical protein